MATQKRTRDAAQLLMTTRSPTPPRMFPITTSARNATVRPTSIHRKSESPRLSGDEDSQWKNSAGDSSANFTRQLRDESHLLFASFGVHRHRRHYQGVDSRLF